MGMDGGAFFSRVFNREFVTQAVKFCLIGLLNTGITWLAFHFLVSSVRIDDNASNVIAYVLGLINSFVWNKLWTFKSGGFKLAEILFFLLAFAVAWGAQFLVYRCFAGFGWRKDVAILPAMAVYTLVGFLVNKLVTFRKGK